MKEIINVEIKRVLNIKKFSIIYTFVLLFSVYSSLVAFNSYNVYDSYGNIIISASENLSESKLDIHKTFLDEETILSIVEGENSSLYLYNRALVTLIATNYEKPIEELTHEDISNFYDERIRNVKENFSGAFIFENIDRKADIAATLKIPIEIGYAEGWKNLNSSMVDFVTIIIYIIPFIILPIFGANLPIQSSINYLFSPYNITFLQQYLLNVVIGFMAMLILVSLTLLITILSGKILSSTMVVVFLLAAMPLLPNNMFTFNYYFRNFLPYNMVNFNMYYIRVYIYDIFGEIIPLYMLVIMVSFIIVSILLTANIIISNKKLKHPLQYY